MTSFIVAFIFSCASNLDNIVVGIAYGIKKIKLSFLSNFIIALITCLGTYLSMTLGALLGHIFPENVANYVGAGVIIILGLYFCIQNINHWFKKYHSQSLALKDTEEMMEYAVQSDKDHSGDMDIKETIVLALGLSFNNLGTGVVASLTGVNPLLTTICTFFISLIAISLGFFLGHHVLGRYIGKYASFISGILLILLGILEFFH